MIDFKQWITDPELELSGVDVKIGDAVFKVARAGNRNFLRKIAALSEQDRARIDRVTKGGAQDGDEAFLTETLLRAQVGTVLVGWDEKSFCFGGKPLPFTEENAMMMLRISDVASVILAAANDRAIFAAKAAEDDAKQ